MEKKNTFLSSSRNIWVIKDPEGRHMPGPRPDPLDREAVRKWSRKIGDEFYLRSGADAVVNKPGSIGTGELPATGTVRVRGFISATEALKRVEPGEIFISEKDFHKELVKRVSPIVKYRHPEAGYTYEARQLRRRDGYKVAGPLRPKGGERLERVGSNRSFWPSFPFIEEQVGNALQSTYERLNQERHLLRQVQAYRRDLYSVRDRAMELADPDLTDYMKLKQKYDRLSPDARARFIRLEMRLRDKVRTMEIVSGEYDALVHRYKEIFEKGLIREHTPAHSLLRGSPFEIYQRVEAQLNLTYDPEGPVKALERRIEVLYKEASDWRDFRGIARDEVSTRGGDTPEPARRDLRRSVSGLREGLLREQRLLDQERALMIGSEEHFKTKPSPAGGRERIRLALGRALTESRQVDGKTVIGPVVRKDYADEWRAARESRRPIRLGGSAVHYRVTGIAGDTVGLKAAHVSPDDLILRVRYEPTIENLQRIARAFNEASQQMNMAALDRPAAQRLGHNVVSLVLESAKGMATQIQQVDVSTILQSLADYRSGFDWDAGRFPKMPPYLENLVTVHAPWARGMLGQTEALPQVAWLAVRDAVSDTAALLDHSAGLPSGRAATEAAKAKAFGAFSDSFLRHFHRYAFEESSDDLMGALVKSFLNEIRAGQITEGEFLNTIHRLRRELDDLDVKGEGWRKVPHYRWLKEASDAKLLLGFGHSHRQPFVVVAAGLGEDVIRHTQGVFGQVHGLVGEELFERANTRVNRGGLARGEVNIAYQKELDREVRKLVGKGVSPDTALQRAGVIMWKRHGFESLAHVYEAEQYLDLFTDHRMHNIARQNLRNNHRLVLSFLREAVRMDQIHALPTRLVHSALAHPQIVYNLLGNVRVSEVGARVIQDLFELVQQTPGMVSLSADRVGGGGMRLFQGQGGMLTQDIATGAFYEVGPGTVIQTKTDLAPAYGWSAGEVSSDSPGKGRPVRSLGAPIDAYMGMGEGRFINYSPVGSFEAYQSLKDDLARGKTGRPVLFVDWETTGFVGKLDEKLVHPTEVAVHRYAVDRGGLRLVSTDEMLFKPSQAVSASVRELTDRLKAGAAASAFTEAELGLLRNIAKFHNAAWAGAEAADMPLRRLAWDALYGLARLRGQGVDLAEGLSRVEEAFRSASRQRGILVGQNYTDADHVWHALFRRKAAGEMLASWRLGMSRELSQIEEFVGRTYETRGISPRAHLARRQKAEILRGIMGLDPSAVIERLDSEDLLRGNRRWAGRVKRDARRIIRMQGNLTVPQLMELIHISRADSPGATSHALSSQVGRLLTDEQKAAHARAAHRAGADTLATAQVTEAYLRRNVGLPEGDWQRIRKGDYLVRTLVGPTIGAGGTAETGRPVRQAFQISHYGQLPDGGWRMTLAPLSGGAPQFIEGRSGAELARNIAKQFVHATRAVAQEMEQEFILDDAERMVRRASYNLRAMVRLATEAEPNYAEQILRQVAAGEEAALERFRRNLERARGAALTADEAFEVLARNTRLGQLQRGYAEALIAQHKGLPLTPAQEALLMNPNDLARMDANHPARPFMRDIFSAEEVIEDRRPFRGTRQRQALAIAGDWTRSTEGRAQLQFMTLLDDVHEAGFIGRHQAAVILRQYNEGKKEIATRATRRPMGLVNLGMREGRDLFVVATSPDRTATGLWAVARRFGQGNEGVAGLLEHLRQNRIIDGRVQNLNQAAATIFEGVRTKRIATAAVESSAVPLALGGEAGERLLGMRLRRLGEGLLAGVLGEDVFRALMAGGIPPQPVPAEGRGFIQSYSVMANKFHRIREARAELPAHRAMSTVRGRAVLEGTNLTPYSTRGAHSLMSTQQLLDEAMGWRAQTEAGYIHLDELKRQAAEAKEAGRRAQVKLIWDEHKLLRSQVERHDRYAKEFLRSTVGRARYAKGAVQEEARALLGWAAANPGEALVGRGLYQWKRLRELTNEELQEVIRNRAGHAAALRGQAERHLAARLAVVGQTAAINSAIVEEAAERGVARTMATEALAADAGGAAMRERTAAAIRGEAAVAARRSLNWKTGLAVGAGTALAVAIAASVLSPRDSRQYIPPGPYSAPQAAGPRPLSPSRGGYVERSDTGLRMRVRASASRPVAENDLGLAVNNTVNDVLGLEARLNVRLRDDRRPIDNQFVGDLFSQLLETGYVTSP